MVLSNVHIPELLLQLLMVLSNVHIQLVIRITEVQVCQNCHQPFFLASSLDGDGTSQNSYGRPSSTRITFSKLKPIPGLGMNRHYVIRIYLLYGPSDVFSGCVARGMIVFFKAWDPVLAQVESAS
jgi:hypothetical protein